MAAVGHHPNPAFVSQVLTSPAARSDGSSWLLAESLCGNCPQLESWLLSYDQPPPPEPVLVNGKVSAWGASQLQNLWDQLRPLLRIHHNSTSLSDHTASLHPFKCRSQGHPLCNPLHIISISKSFPRKLTCNKHESDFLNSAINRLWAIFNIQLTRKNPQ